MGFRTVELNNLRAPLSSTNNIITILLFSFIFFFCYYFVKFTVLQITLKLVIEFCRPTVLKLAQLYYPYVLCVKLSHIEYLLCQPSKYLKLKFILCPTYKHSVRKLKNSFVLKREKSLESQYTKLQSEQLLFSGFSLFPINALNISDETLLQQNVVNFVSQKSKGTAIKN